MASLNHCSFIGNLGRDPETRFFSNGDKITNASIACTESWKDKTSGEKKERTEWVNLVFTGGLADVAEKYLRKGSQIHVSGKFTTRKWQDKDGQERYTTEIEAEEMKMLGSRQGQGEPSYGGDAPAPSYGGAKPAAAAKACRRYCGVPSHTVQRPMMIMMAERIVAVSAPANKVYPKTGISVNKAASLLGINHRESPKRSMEGSRRQALLINPKDSSAMRPRWDPEIERRWTVPVVINHSRTSGARNPCSPMVKLRNRPRAGCGNASAAFRTRLRHASIRDEIG